MTSRLAKKITIRPAPRGHISGMKPVVEGKEPMDNSSSNMKAAKKRGDWAEAAKVSASSHPVTDPAPRTHFKVCNKCNQKKPLADFEGYKRCKDCRERNTK